MRAIYFIVAGALLSIHLFARSVIGVIDLRQREGIDSADRNVIRVLGKAGPKPPKLKDYDPLLVRPPKVPLSPPKDNSGQSANLHSCLEEGTHCAEMIDLASELIKELAKALIDAGGSTTTTSSTFATVITPAPWPNYDAVTAIDMHHYLPLLNTAEQQMWHNQRFCFFANIVRYYSAAARANTKAIPTPTLFPFSFSSLQSDFFSSYMPSALRRAYGVPRNAPLHPFKTTCRGLHSKGFFTTGYFAKAATASTPATAATSTPTTAGSAPPPKP